MEDSSLLNGTETEKEEVVSSKTEQPTQPTETTDWLSSLDEELRSSSSLKDIKDVNSLAKSYVNAQKMLGNSIRIPSNEASTEDRQKFLDKLKTVEGVVSLEDKEAVLDKLGRPKSFEEYTKIESSSEAFDKYAHEIGLTKQQHEALFKFLDKDAEQEQEKLKQSIDNTKKVLLDRYGKEGLSASIESVNALLGGVEGEQPEAVKLIKSGAYDNNPIILTALIEFAKTQVSSKEIPVSKGPSGISPMEAREKINEIRNNPDHPYNKPFSREYKEASKKMDLLYKIAEGE